MLLFSALACDPVRPDFQEPSTQELGDTGIEEPPEDEGDSAAPSGDDSADTGLPPSDTAPDTGTPGDGDTGTVASYQVGGGGRYDSIAEALLDTPSGETILVTEGTWEECIDLGQDDVALQAAGSAEATILVAPHDCSATLSKTGGTGLAKVTGFTVLNDHGAALYLQEAAASLVDVIVRDSGDPADTNTTAVRSYGGTLALERTTFEDNTGLAGGHVSAEIGGSVSITESSFSGGTSGTSGGAIFVGNVDSVTITDTTFSDNAAAEYGGALALWASGPTTCTDCTFDGHTAGWGGTVYVYERRATWSSRAAR